ncbi:MAG: WD40 repeat domain-containing protein [Symploca sp. SIO1B1]|nr:WD40 repeat domain-containing protein [Symploca sp. SIO1B1]
MSNLAVRLAKMPSDQRRATLVSLPSHLAKATNTERLQSVLTNFDFIEAKITEPGLEPQRLIEDYEQASKLTELENVSSLSLIQDALRLASHILLVYPSQVAEQLLGRLLTYDSNEEVQNLLAKAQSSKSTPWLRPLTSSLSHPDSPLLQTITGHPGSLEAVTIAPNGEYFISAGDSELKAWSIESGEELFSIRCDRSDVTDLIITSDGRFVVAAFREGVIQVWSLKNKQEVLTLLGHSGAVLGVAEIAKNYLISASTDKTLKLWDLTQGAAVDTLSAEVGSFNGVAVLSDKRVVSACGSEPSLSRKHHVIKIWDLKEKKELFTLGEHEWPVREVVVTPDGRYAVTASNEILKVWDLLTQVERFTLTGHTWRIKSLAVASNRLIVSASSDGILKIWDIERGKALSTLKGHQAGVLDVAVTPDSKRAISVAMDGTIKVWDLEFAEAGSNLPQHEDAVTKVAVTSDGKRAISTSKDRTAIVWDLVNRKPMLTFRGHTGWVSDIAVMADNRRVVSSSWDGTLQIWNIETGELLSTLSDESERVEAVEVTPNEKYAVSVTEGRYIKVWDLVHQTVRFTLSGHEKIISSIAITPDSKRVISAAADRQLKVWDIETGVELLCFPNNYPPLPSLPDEFGNDSLRGKVVGFIAPLDRTKKMPVISSRRESDNATEQYFLAMRDAKTAVTVMPDCQRIISGSNSGVLNMWDLGTGEELLALDDSASGVTSVCVSPNGRFAFATCGLPHYSSDNTLRVWDLERKQIIARFVGEAPMTSCAIAADGTTVIVGDCMGQIYFFHWEGV